MGVSACAEKFWIENFSIIQESHCMNIRGSRILFYVIGHCTKKSSIRDFLMESLMENFIFCAVGVTEGM